MTQRSMSDNYLFGLDDCFINTQDFSCGIHNEVVDPLRTLQKSAKQHGFELSVASGFRDFNRQLMIWNAKADGKRPVLDHNGKPIDITQLDSWELVQAIMRWSALPGASRHHWGTDIDIYDSNAIGQDYAVQLTLEEVSGDGPFVALHDWLDARIACGDAEGFFRPYQIDRGGVAPERWHLSYAPLAKKFQHELSVDTLNKVLKRYPVALSDTIIEHMDEIYQRFISIPFESYP